MKISTYVALAGAVIVAALSGAADPPASSPPPPGPPLEIHDDPAAVEKGLADALRAFVAGDALAVRRALDAVENNCRRLGPDEQPGFPAKVVSWDTAFHGDLDATRELSARGLLDRAYDRFTFLPRGCLGCHAAAARENVPGVRGPKP